MKYFFKQIIEKKRLPNVMFASALSLLVTLIALVNVVAANASQNVEITQTEEKVISAPNTQDATVDVYQWQIFSPELNDFAIIAGESSEQLSVDYALVKNALNANNQTTIRCNCLNSEAEVIASKDYSITYHKPDKSIDQQIQESVIKQAASGMAFETLGANGLPEAETNDTVTVKIEYVDANDTSKLLGISNSQTFDKSKKYFDWTVQLRTSTGHIYEGADKFIIEPTVAGFTAEYKGADATYPNSVYVAYDNNAPFPSQVNLVTVKVKYVLNTADYYVKPYYEKVDGSYDESIPVKKRTAAIGSSVPDQATINYFATQVYTADLTGWTAAKFTPIILSETTEAATDPTDGKPIELKLNRTWSLCYFNLNGGNNGPAAVYARHGASFNEVTGWVDGHPPASQTPQRDKYTCTGWKANGTGPLISLTDSFGTVPGEDTEYVAQWELALPEGQKVPVTIAYYCEKANDDSYEYSIERYAQVDQSMIDQEYTIPAPANPQTAPYDEDADPYTDRRFPQVTTIDQYTLKANPSEVVDVPGTSNKKYNDLYTYDHCDSVTVSADGTSVCRVYLNRVTFKYRFFNEDLYTEKKWPDDSVKGWKEIEKKWDANILDEFKAINWEQTGHQSYLRPWVVKSTSVRDQSRHEVCYLSNMGFANEDYCYYTAYDKNWPCHLYYYVQKAGTDWPLKTTNLKLTDFYGWGMTDDEKPYYDLIDVLTGAGYSTSEEESINIFGFQTPVPLGETKELNEYFGSANINGSGEKYHVKDGGWKEKTNNDGAFIGSYDWWANDYHLTHSGVSNHNGLKYFYKRNKHQLRLKNIFGTESQYHDDFAASVTTTEDDNTAQTGGVHFELPLNQFKFQLDEKQKSGADGVTGIKEGTSFLEYIPGTGSNGINDRPPSNVDQHFVFAGWYEDPACTIQVTEYNYITGEHKFVGDKVWEMPNHQQDLYAKWIAPEREIQFMVPELDGTEDEFKYTENGKETITYLDPMINYDNQKVYPTDAELQALQDAHPSYRFIGYYYYASAEDKGKKAKTYFDPKKMTMPWCDYSELSSNDGIPRIVVHQHWEAEKEVDYETHFILSDDETGQTMVADTMIGRDKIDEKVTVNALDVTNTTAFKLEFRGIIEFDSSKGPATHDITLVPWTSGPNPNTWTFYYKYKAGPDYEFKYQIEHWCHVKDSDSNDVEKTWTSNVISNEHSNLVNIQPPLHPKAAPAGKTPDDFNLLSAGEITQTLTLGDPTIIKIYYSEVNHIEFAYRIKTLDYQDNVLTNITGGTISKQFDSVPYYNESHCLAKANPAFTITWYASNADKSDYDSSKPIDTKWITDKDGGKDLCAPNVDGVYVAGDTYWAVFKENASVDFTYQAITVNKDTLVDVDYSGGSVSGTSAHLDHAIWETTPTITSSTPSAGTNGYFIAWATKDADGNYKIIESTRGKTDPFAPTGKTYDNYTYYEKEKYFALFAENQIEIKYQVAATDTEFGSVASASENVYPHETDEAAGSTAVPNRFYHFVNWTKADGTTEVSTDATFKPQKAGTPAAFASETYIAHFAKNDEICTVYFLTEGEGFVDPADNLEVTKGASFDLGVDSALDITDFNSEVKTVIPWAYDGNRFDKWTMLDFEGQEHELSTITNKDIDTNVTFKAYFVPDVKPVPDPDPVNPDPTAANAKTGDSIAFICAMYLLVQILIGSLIVISYLKKKKKI